MTSKKKLLTALGMFALVAVVAAVSVGITFAALSGTVSSSFNITYTASNVEATVSAKYSTNGEAENAGTLTEIQVAGKNSFDFELGTTNEAAQAVSFDAVEGKTFATPTSFIYIAFSFTNNSTGYALKVSANYTPDTQDPKQENVKMYYAWAETAGDTLPEEITTQFTGAIENDHVIAAKAGDAATTNVLWIKVEIDDNIKSATFAGDFSFTLANGDAVGA